jgi:hypothetical protein
VHFVADQRHERLLDLMAVGSPNHIDLDADGSRCGFQFAGDSFGILVAVTRSEAEIAFIERPSLLVM